MCDILRARVSGGENTMMADNDIPSSLNGMPMNDEEFERNLKVTHLTWL